MWDLTGTDKKIYLESVEDDRQGPEPKNCGLGFTLEPLRECNQCVHDKSTSLSFQSWVACNAACVHEPPGSIFG